MKQSRFILPLNIQLFAEEPIDVSADPVDPQPTPEPTKVIDEQVDPVNPQPTDEPVKPVQSQEDNAKFAAARREAEARARQLELDNQRLLKTLGQYGYSGSAQEIADLLEAQQTQKPIEQVRAEREALEQQQLKETQTQQELEHYKGIAMQSLVQQGIDKINKAFQGANIKSINDLGEEFVKLIGAGLDEIEAYEVIQTRENRTKIQKPPTTGAINTTTTAEKSYYSPDEVDKLTEKDLDNPKIMEIVRKSMLKWKS